MRKTIAVVVALMAVLVAANALYTFAISVFLVYRSQGENLLPLRWLYLPGAGILIAAGLAIWGARRLNQQGRRGDDTWPLWLGVLLMESGVLLGGWPASLDPLVRFGVGLSLAAAGAALVFLPRRGFAPSHQPRT